MIDLSIIIVNWNTRDLLCQCLSTIDQAAIGITYEVVVVDNGSADGSTQAIRDAFPLVHVIANAENVGFARANNQGIRASRGRHILLLNSDTLAQPSAFTQLVRFLDAHPDVGIVGPTLLNGDGTVQLSWAEFPTLWSEVRGVNVRRRRRYLSHDGSETYAVDWVGGACLLIRRAAADQIGPLDERYFMYSEETDWCFRARRCGWQVCFYAAARVTHLGGQSSRKASAQMKAELYRSKVRFFSKHYSRFSAQAFRLLLQVLFLSRAVLGWLLYRGSLNLSRRAGTLYHDSLEVFRVVGSRLESSRP